MIWTVKHTEFQNSKKKKKKLSYEELLINNKIIIDSVQGINLVPLIGCCSKHTGTPAPYQFSVYNLFLLRNRWNLECGDPRTECTVVSFSVEKFPMRL